ncbi:helix-turn-helix transcriptional regulator [Blautia liquoris]|uniref:Helix-turn-helix transcriptional regulator n=1 Tax=Blautia liquoris TaxID=2779518 RepID=A0A7M2RF70_9FIRM|nr:helix-turn-helix domain-containing protein [Blautia liquoris]QOV18986.1 helix-turn-helix transcriptional regulator [Blautia liquoris]
MDKPAKKITGSELTEAQCPLRYLLKLLGGKWKLPIICVLVGDKPLRYSTIKRRLGDITNMMLSQSLRELEEADLVIRKQFNEVPPHVEYSLSNKGRSILPALSNVINWAVNNMELDIGCGPNCENCVSQL